MNRNQAAALLIAAAAGYWLYSTRQPPLPVQGSPVARPVPAPTPEPEPKPKKPKPGPWDDCTSAVAEQVYGAGTVGGPTSPDGKIPVQVDLPVGQRIKNIGSHKDGAGMCVFSSCEMSMRWANLEHMRGWRDWCAQNYPGGGYPSKVDKLMEAYCKAKNLPIPDYIQYEGGDPAILKLALKTGRLPSITYNGRDPHYSGSIAHMTNCPCYDDDSGWAVCLDNNFIGENELVWLKIPDFLSRWKGGGGGWAVVFLANPPPPPPKN